MTVGSSLRRRFDILSETLVRTGVVCIPIGAGPADGSCSSARSFLSLAKSACCRFSNFVRRTSPPSPCEDDNGSSGAGIGE